MPEWRATVDAADLIDVVFSLVSGLAAVTVPSLVGNLRNAKRPREQTFVVWMSVAGSVFTLVYVVVAFACAVLLPHPWNVRSTVTLLVVSVPLVLLAIRTQNRLQASIRKADQ